MIFDECKVNRDKLGRFAEKSVSELRASQAIELEDKHPVQVKGAKPEHKSIEEFFGVEHKGVKGMAAIEKLLQERNGHVKGAFYRKEVGDIDLVWGDESGGLSHAIKRRDKYLAEGKGTINGLEMAKKIPEIIENGVFDKDDIGRMKITYQDYKVGIHAEYDGKKVVWIVTAMEKIK